MQILRGSILGVAHLFVMQRDGEMPVEPDDEKPINVGGASAILHRLFSKRIAICRARAFASATRN